MRLKSDLTLLLVAAIWGSGFVAQRFAAARLGAFYFNAGRFLLGALLLLPLTRLKWKVTRRQLPWMILAGGVLFAASGFQQTGLETTTIGNAGFITGLYVVLIPVILFLVWRKRVYWVTWAAALVACGGIALLSLHGGLHLAHGDALELCGALMWALHVILVGKIADQRADVLWFAVIQFAACGLLSLAVGLGLNPQGMADYQVSWQAVLYSAVFPTCLGFTLQAVGQKGAPPTDASIIMSMEAVFGALFGYLFMHEGLELRQVMGCLLILAAILLAQFGSAPANASGEPAAALASADLAAPEVVDAVPLASQRK